MVDSPQFFCTLCCEPMRDGYVREIAARLSCCGLKCSVDHCLSAALIFEKSREGIMSRPTIFTIHSSREGESIETHRISAVVAVAEARRLNELGWRVRVTDRTGRQFNPRFRQASRSVFAAFNAIYERGCDLLGCVPYFSSLDFALDCSAARRSRTPRSARAICDKSGHGSPSAMTRDSNPR
jgi:hypothetical protein